MQKSDSKIKSSFIGPIGIMSAKTLVCAKMQERLNLCLAQIRFVINAPKQVTKPKGYVAALITLILLIRS
jgi:hypothetical protein